jgi:hypothetical protein
VTATRLTLFVLIVRLLAGIDPFGLHPDGLVAAIAYIAI